jgi:hypothetical protein
MTPRAIEQALRCAADLFHEIGSAIGVKDLLVDVKNEVMVEKLREKLRSPDQLRRSAADGLELCKRTLLVSGVVSPVLNRGAELFHEIENALLGEQLASIIQRMQQAALDVPDPGHQQGSSTQLRRLTAEGFELCVRALADLGATDVTIHECGKSAFGEQPWSGDE